MRLYGVIIGMLFVVSLANGNDSDDNAAAEHLEKCMAEEALCSTLKECDKAIVLTDDKTIHVSAYIAKSVAHLNFESYEQSIENATSAITLLKNSNNITDEKISAAYIIRAISAYELALATIRQYPVNDKEKQPYRKALQDINKAIAVNPVIAEDEQIRDLRNRLRNLAH